MLSLICGKQSYFNDAGQGMRCGSHGVRALPVIDILDGIILQE